MTQSFTIRPEKDSDLAAVRAVHVAAFPTPTEADLVDLLRAHGKGLISLVAEANGGVVGHILFSPVTVAGVAGDGVGLAPVAVLPGFQRKGIGSRLIETGLAECRARGFGFSVVLGEPGYYSRFGFEKASEFGLQNEYGADKAFRMISFREGALPPDGGMVKYAEEFALFE